MLPLTRMVHLFVRMPVFTTVLMCGATMLVRVRRCKLVYSISTDIINKPYIVTRHCHVTVVIKAVTR